MKKTLLAIMLTLALAVSCVFGLAACKNDKAIVVKEGKTNIGDVTSEATSYDLEGTVGNYYTLTATVNGETCTDVYLMISAGIQGYGRIEQFEYFDPSLEDAELGKNLKVTVSAAETVSNVVLVLEKVDAPAAPTPAEYEAIELSTTVTPELDGAEYVTYKLVIAKEGTYIVSGDINLGSATELANIIIGKELDENGAVDAGNPVEIDAEAGTMILEAATYYVTVYAEDSFMIAIVPEYNGTINVSTDDVDNSITIDKLGATPVRYKLNGEAGEYYTVTATVKGEASEHLAVSVKVANGAAFQGLGTVAQFAYVEGETDVVTLSVVVTTENPKDIPEDLVVELKNVELKLVKVDPPAKVEYPAITLGTAVTDGDYGKVYKLVITETATYQVTGDIDIGSMEGIDWVPGDIEISTGLTEGFGGSVELDQEGMQDIGYGVDSCELEAGTYYVKVYSNASFTISKVVE